MGELLKGEKCLVIGATGNIGRGAAKAFLEHGADQVALLGRDEEKLSKLAREYLADDERVTKISSDITTPEGAEVAAEQLKSELGKVHHVVSSSGPWWDVGPLSELDPNIWHTAIQSNFSAHFYGFRYLSGLVEKGGSYIIMNGAAALGLPQTGLTGITANALRGLCKVLHAEGNKQGLRVHELLLQFRVAYGEPSPGMKSRDFGQVFAAIAAGRNRHPAGTTIEMSGESDLRELTAQL
jgi:3-oxoacyl-[acyl-carrier protein] reductase